ncbi:MAG: ATP-binding cassette domain-containing protein [Ignavibacteriales bacterium]|nr:ATP-binding cassette domain-containing protein [Ignavibacteriales bacterium]MCF8316024.1 ATP-binding cassette domain-containing protein [Ignavibacteriales bacterium]MCF8437618.1 ATP-binding cassette domain-containing protein [Ignavibacteriales bacterium]
MEELLIIRDLNKHYDGIIAVDKVNFTIMPGTITGIYGDNGAGKTTLFNIISGFEKADMGNVVFEGEDITRKSVIYRSRKGIGRLFQIPRIFSDVSVLDNLLAAGNNHEAKYLHNYVLKPAAIRQNILKDRDKAKNILKEFNLTSKAGLKAFELSVGEKRLLSLCSLLMNEAKLLLLDEPFAGINEIAALQIQNYLISLKSRGMTLVMIEHDKTKLFELADSVYEMKQGSLLKKTSTSHANY